MEDDEDAEEEEGEDDNAHSGMEVSVPPSSSNRSSNMRMRVVTNEGASRGAGVGDDENQEAPTKRTKKSCFVLFALFLCFCVEAKGLTSYLPVCLPASALFCNTERQVVCAEEAVFFFGCIGSHSSLFLGCWSDFSVSAVD
jgi:hypothetical protein